MGRSLPSYMQRSSAQQGSCRECRASIRSTAKFCPHCGTAVQPPASEKNARRVAEITFNELRANDSLLIETRNSTYNFSIVDPKSRLGVLSGGALSDHAEDATLIGVKLESGAVDSDTSRLTTHSRALFYLHISGCFRSLTTSVITSLVHIRGADSERRITLS